MPGTVLNDRNIHKYFSKDTRVIGSTVDLTRRDFLCEQEL